MSEELKVLYDGGDTYAARDISDATAMWEENNDCAWAAEHGDDPPESIWSERDLDALGTIRFEDSIDTLNLPEGAVIVERWEPAGGKVRATWRAWAKVNGRGMICTENY